MFSALAVTQLYVINLGVKVLIDHTLGENKKLDK